MVIDNLKGAICALFEVHAEAGGIYRVVTPMEYAGSGDRVVVRVRPHPDGGALIDENGEAALNATLVGGDTDSEAVNRWVEELEAQGTSFFDPKTEIISTRVERPEDVAPHIFRVAQAAQQLHTLALARQERQSNDFRQRVVSVIREIGAELGIKVSSEVALPIVGELKADAVLETPVPLIVIAATSQVRLVQAEVTHLQYRAEKRPGRVLAVVESQGAVGRREFERAAYFTHKAIVFDPSAFSGLIKAEAGEQASGLH